MFEGHMLDGGWHLQCSRFSFQVRMIDMVFGCEYWFKLWDCLVIKIKAESNTF